MHTCYPSVCEVVTLGSKVQVLLGYIASSKPAWNPGDSHFQKERATTDGRLLVSPVLGLILVLPGG